ERLDELVAGNDEHVAMVRQLEALYDATPDAANPPLDVTPMAEGELPTADELGAEFERFLRDQNNG
ncbi:MAG TPA: PAC2 family protein, partial [Ilumatobacteraceae bacterium]|nr:PAC2 family protein [Ilumatobacteraceae bacterium]